MPEHLELCPGNPGTPLFKTEKERLEFERDWHEKVTPALEKLPRPVRFWSIGICPRLF
jgi:hypothetical protein